MIIDCHTHLNRYVDTQKASLLERIRALEAEMRQNRVDMAIILSSYVSNESRPSVQELVEATSDKDHLSVVGGVSIAYSQQDLSVLRELLREGRLVGLKIYPGYEPFYPHDEKMRAVYDLAAEFQVPVMIHSGDTYSAGGKVKFAHPLHIDEVAVDNRSVNFVICHMGNPWFHDTMELVYKNPNVYTDISGLVLGDFTDRFEKYMSTKVQEFILFGVDSSNLLYGTDWPISSMRSYLDFVNDLKIPPKERKEILYSNAAKLFRLSEKSSLIEPSLKWTTPWNRSRSEK